MRRVSVAIGLMFLLFVFTSVSLKANAAPPANIRLTVLHDGVDFDFDFLIPFGKPLSASDIQDAEDKLENALENDDLFMFYYRDDHFPDALITYQDSENFVSNALYGSSRYYYHYPSESGDEDVFFLYFTTPLRFKAAVVIDDAVITSPFIEMTQFDFHLTWDIRGVDVSVSAEDAGEVSGFTEHPLTRADTYVHFVVRVLFTVSVELAILFAFGFRFRKTFVQVGLLNVVTQSLLTVATLSLFLLSHQSTFGVLVLFVFGEVLIYLVETFYLVFFVSEKSVARRVLFSLTANTVTMLGGLHLMVWRFNMMA